MTTPCVRSFLFGLLWSVPVLAQGIETVPQSFGASLVDGRIVAGGPDFAARFDERGFEFVPALGRKAPHTYPLRFTLVSVQRGSAVGFRRDGDGTAPTLVGNTVRYEHRQDLLEVYDVRRDGIEQSFVFAEQPAGHGDLVVRGEITTELPLTAAGEDGLCFELAGLGGITFGAVTGVDANGKTARGSMRLDGNALELVLPGAFVEQATYPLVLDPLIGSAFTVANDAVPDENPKVAFDASTNRYLVVWQVNLATGARELRGRLVSTAGALLGSQIVIAPTAETFDVASIHATNRFLVAFSWRSTIGPVTVVNVQAVAVNASNAATSATLNVVSATNPVAWQVVVGGDSRTTASAQNALVVTRLGGLSAPPLHVQLVQVPSSGTPILVSTPSPGSQSVNGDISITKHAGAAGRWLLFWPSGTGLVSAVIDASGSLCAPPMPLAVPALSGSCACATSDGSHFLAAWRASVAGIDQVQVCPLTWFGNCGAGTLVAGPVITPSPSPNPQDHPAVDFAKDKYVLTWTQGGVSRTHAMGLAPTTGAPAGADHLLDSGLFGNEHATAIASHWSGGDTTSDEALVVWSNTSIRARRFEATGTGTITNLGGACGTIGGNDFATYSGTPVLGTTFTIELLAPTAPVLALIVGFSQNPFACGPCTIVPSGDIVLAGGGPVPINVPLDPILIGFELYTQWLQLRQSGCPILPDFGFSNTLKFTIAE